MYIEYLVYFVEGSVLDAGQSRGKLKFLLWCSYHNVIKDNS